MDIFQRQGRDVISKSRKPSPKSLFDDQNEAIKGRPKSCSLIRLRLSVVFGPFATGRPPPVGASQGTPKPGSSVRGRRPRPRICLRKGCGRKYRPRRWNQRYCQDPQCQREVRRWQAARRQARHRQHVQAKARHARAEKARRQRAKSAPQPIHSPGVPSARGHAAEHFFLRRYATDRAAMSIPRARPVTPPDTAAPPAGRPFARSTTGNASGSPAAPGMAG